MRRIAWGGLLLLVVGCALWLGMPRFEPRQAVLGNWREAGSKIRVEVNEMQASWRGAGRGAARYEWQQTEDEPYRVRITHGRHSVEANLSFSGKDEWTLEPDVWDQLPPDAQRMLGEINRRNGRPEREFRLIFRRDKGK